MKLSVHVSEYFKGPDCKIFRHSCLYHLVNVTTRKIKVHNGNLIL